MSPMRPGAREDVRVLRPLQHGVRKPELRTDGTISETKEEKDMSWCMGSMVSLRRRSCSAKELSWARTAIGNARHYLLDNDISAL